MNKSLKMLEELKGKTIVLGILDNDYFPIVKLCDLDNKMLMIEQFNYETLFINMDFVITIRLGDKEDINKFNDHRAKFEADHSFKGDINEDSEEKEDINKFLYKREN